MTIYFFKFPLEDSLGGAEWHTLKLAEHFRKQGKAVRLITSDHFLSELFQKRGLDWKNMFVGWEPTSKLALLLWPLTYFLAQRKFKTLLRGTPAGEIFFLQSLTEKLLLTPLALRQKIKVIWIEHKVPGRWLKLNPLLPRFRELAQAVSLLTVSNFTKQEFVKLGIPERNIHVIYPGVETDHVATTPPPNFTIGLLSRLAPEKGVKNFLEIIAPALATHKTWKILVAGTGPEKQKIQNFIRSQKLETKIRMLGYVTDLDEYLAKISVLVYPSLALESFGLAVAEALSRGIPVVASKLGALPEIIEHQKTGFLVESNQPEQWRQFLELLENQDAYQTMSHNTMQNRKKFSDTQMFAALEGLMGYVSAPAI